VAAPRKFDEETRARAIRLYNDWLRDHGESKLAARKHVGELLDINPATLRNWVESEQGAVTPVGSGAVGSGADSDEVARLRKENAELRRANEILKTASAFFAAAELDRPSTQVKLCPVRRAELEEAYLVNEIVDLYRRNNRSVCTGCGGPPSRRARRHFSTCRWPTRRPAAISAVVWPRSNRAPACNRTRSRARCSFGVSPPPCAYLIDRAYRKDHETSRPPPSPVQPR
jgi:hypothetical protein